MGLDDLKRVPPRIGCAVGAEKVPAIRAAARVGYINTLVTDSSTAKLLIAAGPGRRERGAARMTGYLDGVRALVTGASKGIGVAICERLAAEGARIVASGRDRTSLYQLAERLREAHHAETVCLPADLADPDAVTPLADAAWEAFDGLDLLVNNAGMSIMGPATAMSRADWDTVMAVNLHSPAMLAADLGRRMADGGGGRICHHRVSRGAARVARPLRLLREQGGARHGDQGPGPGARPPRGARQQHLPHGRPHRDGDPSVG